MFVCLFADLLCGLFRGLFFLFRYQNVTVRTLTAEHAGNMGIELLYPQKLAEFSARRKDSQICNIFPIATLNNNLCLEQSKVSISR